MKKSDILQYISDNYTDQLVMLGVALENSQRHLFYVIDDAAKGETDEAKQAIADRETRQLIRDRSAYMGLDIPVWPDDELTPPGDEVPSPPLAAVVNEGQSAIPLLDEEE